MVLQACYKCKLGDVGALVNTDDIKSIKLIVVGSNPDIHEYEAKEIFAENVESTGKFFKTYLNQLFLDLFPQGITTQTYFTYGVKCFKKEKTITPKEINACSKAFLKPEINKINNNAPILLCGRAAISGLLGSKINLKNHRQTIFSYKQHPVIPTFDLSTIYSSLLYTFNSEISQLKEDIVEGSLNKINASKILNNTTMWQPVLAGTPLWFFNQDLLILKKTYLSQKSKIKSQKFY